MAAFKYTFRFEKGATYDEYVIYKAGSPAVPVDLTGCTAKGQIRASIDSEDVLLEMSTTNGMIVLGGDTGRVSFAVPSTITAAMDWEEGVHDVELTFTDGRVKRLLAGPAFASPEVTRE